MYPEQGRGLLQRTDAHASGVRPPDVSGQHASSRRFGFRLYEDVAREMNTLEKLFDEWNQGKILRCGR